MFAKGQRVKATVYGQPRTGKVIEHRTPGIVWVQWNGEESATWMHASSLTRRDDFGVFVYRADGEYVQDEAVRTYVTEKAAERHAKKLNETNCVHVVRPLRLFPEARTP